MAGPFYCRRSDSLTLKRLFRRSPVGRITPALRSGPMGEGRPQGGRGVWDRGVGQEVPKVHLEQGLRPVPHLPERLVTPLFSPSPNPTAEAPTTWRRRSGWT